MAVMKRMRDNIRTGVYKTRRRQKKPLRMRPFCPESISAMTVGITALLNAGSTSLNESGGQLGFEVIRVVFNQVTSTHDIAFGIVSLLPLLRPS